MNILNTISQKRKVLVDTLKSRFNKRYDDLLRIQCRLFSRTTTKIFHRSCFETYKKESNILEFKILHKVKSSEFPLNNPKRYYCEVCKLSELPLEFSLREAKINKNHSIKNYDWKKMVVALFKEMIENKPDTIFISSHSDYTPCSAYITKNNDYCTCGYYADMKYHWDGRPESDDISIQFNLGFINSIKARSKKIDLWVLDIMTTKAFNSEDQEHRLKHSTKDCFDKTIVLPVKYLTKEVVRDAVQRWINKNVPQLINIKVEWKQDNVN